jgi:predicted AlkP superfamily pyrophosphatase or phosphodiesterase
MKSTFFADGRRRMLPVLQFLFLGLFIPLGTRCDLANAAAQRPPARIFVLMVWDGLRPDFVTAEWTPNLFAMANEGVRFARHHSIYPTITMVDAASIATGALPGITTILGDQMYLVPRLNTMKLAVSPNDSWTQQAVFLEDSNLLAALNGPAVFNGALLGSESLGQQVRREGDYLAIVGKRGPTFTFDDSVTGDLAMGARIAAGNYIFVGDDLVAPASLKDQLAAAPPKSASEKIALGMRDAYFASVVAKRALPEAKAAALGGHPALVVFWQHNPDLTQHYSGLGTQADLDALKLCDTNLGIVRHAIASLAIGDRTDLMVVSDHGFATIRASVPLAHLLVAKGLKKSDASDDVIVVRNGGTDLVHLSRSAFPTMKARRAVLQKIVDFAQAQPWSGPLFTRSAGEERALAGSSAKSSATIESPHDLDDRGRGWIEGTFSLDVVGLIGRNNFFDAPDLVVSFRELPDVDNSGLTGPNQPTYVIGIDGEQKGSTANQSDPLVAPVKGVLYADAGDKGVFATGFGTHAAAGARELLNFCAAAGPDFRRGFVDQYPSGNLDLRATIARAMGLPSGNDATSAGRSLDEALAGDQLNATTNVKATANFKATTNESRLTVGRKLPTMEVTTILDFSVLSVGPHRWSYLDGAEYKRTPLKESK